MISFELDEIETLTQSMVRGVTRDIIRPVAASIDDTCEIPETIRSVCWETGIVQALLDQDPGSSRSRVLSCVVLEELGWGDASTAVALGSSMAFAQAIVDHGSSLQRDDLSELASGAAPLSAAVLIQEPGLGAHPGAIRTRVEKAGNGFRMNGAKSFVPRAARCTHFLVLAQSDVGVRAIIVPAHAPGVTVEAPKGSLGLKGVAFSSVRFHNVVLPLGAQLGGDNGCDVSSLIASSRTGLASIMTGVARAVFEYVTPYTKERVAHGAALARKQSVAFRLADMFIDVPSMRWMAWRSAAALQKGRDAAREARLAHIYCGERALAIADEGLQLMGGHGYIRDNPMERWLRDARTLSLLEGLVGV